MNWVPVLGFQDSPPFRGLLDRDSYGSSVNLNGRSPSRPVDTGPCDVRDAMVTRAGLVLGKKTISGFPRDP